MSKAKKTVSAQKPQAKALWIAIGVGLLALVAAVVALISNSARPTYTPEVSGAPRAKVDQTTVDHGAVRFEQMVESVYVIKNVGNRPLTILEEPRVELLQGC